VRMKEERGLGSDMKSGEISCVKVVIAYLLELEELEPCKNAYNIAIFDY
jgi:hypothetical protein